MELWFQDLRVLLPVLPPPPSLRCCHAFPRGGDAALGTGGGDDPRAGAEEGTGEAAANKQALPVVLRSKDAGAECSLEMARFEIKTVQPCCFFSSMIVVVAHLMPGTAFRSVWLAVLSLSILCCSVRAQEAVSAPVQTLLKEGDSAFSHGDYDAALRSFEKAQQMAQQLPADSTVRYEILKRLTSTSAASGQFNNAERYIEQAVKWRESTIGPKDSKLVDDLLLLINLKMRTKEFDQALAIAKRVQAMHVAAYTPESMPVADDLLRIGQIYLAQKKPTEAVRSLITAIDVRTRLVGSLDPGLLPALDQEIEAFRALAGGECPGCETIYRHALAIRETLYGLDSTELISTVEGLADVYSSEGMFAAAEPLYLRLLALWEKAVGEDHPMVAVTLDKLVVFYARVGESDKAQQALTRSVAIRARFLAVGLSHEAVDEIARGHGEEARTLYNRALAALGPLDPANEELIGQIREAMRKLQSSPPK